MLHYITQKIGYVVKANKPTCFRDQSDHMTVKIDLNTSSSVLC